MKSATFQSFVAWRYLLERNRRFPPGMLLFAGVTLWLAVGMGVAALLWPMTDSEKVVPPNLPPWLVVAISMASVMPAICLIAALAKSLFFVVAGGVRIALNARRSARGLLVPPSESETARAVVVRDTSKRPLFVAPESKWFWYGAHWGLAALALFGLANLIFGLGNVHDVAFWSADTSVFAAEGINLALAVAVALSLIAVVPLGMYLTRQIGPGPIRIMTSIVGLPTLVALSVLVAPLSFLMARRADRPRWARALRTSAIVFELGLAALAAVGFKNVFWPSLSSTLVLVPYVEPTFWACTALATGGLVLWAIDRIRGVERNRLQVVTGLALCLALTCVIVQCLFNGLLHSVATNLDFFGGYDAYVPPMGLMIASMIAAVLVLLSLLFAYLRYVFTFFTTVSIAGVIIGTMALVIVLSVMSGFESDLRDKILGFSAHIQISHSEELQFGDYEKVEAILDGTDGVVGYTPFLTTEVYISNRNNYGNVLIKGINPERIAGVTDIVKNLESGDERALEKLWPLDEDGNIIGRPAPARVPTLEPATGPDAGTGDVEDPAPSDLELPDLGPADFSGGLTEVPAEDDALPADLKLPDEGPLDFSAGMTEIPDAGPSAAAASRDAGMDIPLPDRADDGDAGPDDGRALVLPDDAVVVPAEWHEMDPFVAQLSGVLVGRELTNQINLYTDQEVRVISPLLDTSPDGMSVPRIRSFRVAGGFYSGMYEYDLKYVYVELGALQDFLEIGDQVNGIEVRVDDPQATDAIVADLRVRLGDDYRVQDWKELNRALFSALKLEKIAMFLVLVIIILVASFSIIGNLIMVVVEKAKEIAIIKTLGAADDSVMQIFIVQGFFIGLVGTVLGIACGLIASYAMEYYGVPLDPDIYYIDRLPIQVELLSVLAVGVAGLAISVIATIYPAFVAARMRPVKGLRWD